MRVIAGTARGRKLHAPKGDATRPTSDKVRGAIFNILFSSRGAPEGARVLDLFAGTGALGIEALSRGAASAIFVEMDRRTADVLERNLAETGFADRATLLLRDAESAAGYGEPFDIVFADPPYALVQASRALASLASLLAPGGIAVVEHAEGEPPPVPAGLVAADERRYGSTAVTFYSAET